MLSDFADYPRPAVNGVLLRVGGRIAEEEAPDERVRFHEAEEKVDAGPQELARGRRVELDDRLLDQRGAVHLEELDRELALGAEVVVDD